MPKRTDIKSIAIIGSGPIVIGQAAEFDYSGTQGCRALRKEGYRIVLVNSNPATIMTDPEIADATYIEPINAQTVARILEKERPDALLPTLGGQTALNVAMELAENGTLEKLGVELIGANREAIRKSEDRQAFKEAMRKIGMDVPRSSYAASYDQAMAAAKDIGYPAIIRPSFTLGGTGGNIAYNHEEYDEFVRWGLAASPRHEILVEESVIGWKEFELEVMRDRADNVVIVCSIENLDPMGVHTGDSITVAPIQTLTDREYQKMRDAAIAIIREIGVDTGGCNIQFAVDPVTGRQTVIEMNPRVSRSSSLASKATGYPIASIAARVAVGYTLDEITNEITGNTPVSFEPTIDYVVTKIPRFAFEKFPDAATDLTTQMKSVGEVMSIGRTFEESLQKALRSLEIDRYGLEEKFKLSDWRVRRRAGMEDAPPKLEERLRHPTPGRPWYIAEAFRAGLTIERVHELTGIDPWFLQAFKRIVGFETQLAKIRSESPSKSDLVMGLKPVLREAKRMGFADRRLGQLLDLPEHEIRALREEEGVAPVFKTVDTCAAEFESSTPYHYSTYDGIENEVRASSRRKIMILGSGPNRIGQGIEFDYCCVHAAYSLRASGFETIMVNCNPETVSTDWLTSDRLYFEPLTLEDVLAIVRQEQPEGVIVQFGGQTPLKLASGLAQAGVPILGTQPDAIDLAEDRERFRTLLDSLNLKQPASGTARSVEEALQVAAKLGYPVLVRPSYVLGGRAMKVVYEPAQLTAHLESALEVSNERPILVDRFLEDAIEVDVDAIGDGKEVVVAGVMEQIQEAGVHSGDSACALPPYSLEQPVIDEIRRQTVALGKALKVVGLMNVQFAVRSGEGAGGVVVLEVNPRASRTVPFVSKATGVPLAKLAAQVMAGKSLAELSIVDALFRPQHMSVKEAVFPFAKFPGVDPVLGPEMKSTGEVMGIDEDFGRAFAKSQHAANMVLPTGGTVFVSVRDRDKPQVLPVAKKLVELGFVIVATEGTRRFLNDRGVAAGPATKFSEGRPNIVDFIIDGKIALVINTPKGAKAASDSSRLRRATVQYGVPYYTTVAAAKAAVRAIETLRQGPLGVRPLQEYHAAGKAMGGGKNPGAAQSRDARIGS